MKQQSKNHSAGVSIGMVSILMIFVVLCLTTFATLSFVSARADLKLSKKASDSVSEYYAADSAAETYLAQIASQLETADSSCSRQFLCPTHHWSALLQKTTLCFLILFRSTNKKILWLFFPALSIPMEFLLVNFLSRNGRLKPSLMIPCRKNPY